MPCQLRHNNRTTPSFASANDTPPLRGTVPLLWRGRGGKLVWGLASVLFIIKK
ncbi:MAG: hypothetical protein FWG85_00350 [Bacteroidetes bacterium]|nr:hypothetical protein [Bacteroidota bacterium]